MWQVGRVMGGTGGFRDGEIRVEGARRLGSERLSVLDVEDVEDGRG